MPISMMKYYLVDLMAEPGHLNYVQYYVKLLNEDRGDKFICVNGFELPLDNGNCIVIRSKFLTNNTNKYRYVINQLILTAKTFLRYRKRKDITLVFLNYDTISMFLALKMLIRFVKFDLWVVNHNNIDAAFKSRIKKVMLRYISNEATPVVVEDYIKPVMDKTFYCSSKVLRHPLVCNEGQEWSNYQFPTKEQQLFIPSSVTLIEDLELLHTSFPSNVKFVVKQQTYTISLPGREVVVSEYFDDFHQILLKSKYVFLSVDYHMRVSAMLYESLCSCCLILMKQGAFSSEMKKLYPEVVYFINNDFRFNDLDFSLVKIVKAKDKLISRNGPKAVNIELNIVSS
jgi:hypothetical protein